MMMEAVSTSETSDAVYQATRRESLAESSKIAHKKVVLVWSFEA
jgi:hypothetical protein